MTQRTWAALLAVPLFVAIGLYVAVSPLPFVTFSPGPTINVLGHDDGGKSIIRVAGHRTYHDGGELRMTTVSESEATAKLDLLTLVRAWVSPDVAVYPYTSVYSAGETSQQSAHAGHVQMLTSQQSAEAAAMSELGYPVEHTTIRKVEPGLPADGHIEPGDVVVSVGGTKVVTPTDVARQVQAVPPGRSVAVTLRRGNHLVTTQVTPVTRHGRPLIGVSLRAGYHFPFTVKVRINELIGGPSAGMMFALSIYDILTPGSLTDGQDVAGTGTITADGQVGEIGGIQQKIAGARQDGAGLFLVPPSNCADAVDADHGSMRLVKAVTLHEAIHEVRAWTADHGAALPACKGGGS
jgi:PDZ domain-containing protein